MSTHDDDALTWDDGTDDASHVDHRATATSAPAVVAPATAGSAALVVYGIIGGAYLLFTVGWILAALRDSYSVPNLFGEIMYQLGQFLAIVAPALWFGVVFILTRHRGTVIRVVWLVVGAALLAPWPFILSGAIA